VTVVVGFVVGLVVGVTIRFLRVVAGATVLGGLARASIGDS
jgi:hypothetical protein